MGWGSKRQRSFEINNLNMSTIKNMKASWPSIIVVPLLLQTDQNIVRLWSEVYVVSIETAGTQFTGRTNSCGH
jgi:hypothetical protein